MGADRWGYINDEESVHGLDPAASSFLIPDHAAFYPSRFDVGVLGFHRGRT